MALLEFHSDLKTTNDYLARIAVALERIAGPPMPLPEPTRQTGPDDVSYIDDVALAMREADEEARRFLRSQVMQEFLDDEEDVYAVTQQPEDEEAAGEAESGEAGGNRSDHP